MEPASYVAKYTLCLNHLNLHLFLIFEEYSQISTLEVCHLLRE